MAAHMGAPAARTGQRVICTPKPAILPVARTAMKEVMLKSLDQLSRA